MQGKQPTMGDNRTGTARAKGRTEEMLEGIEEFVAAPKIDEDAGAQVRKQYASEAEPLGSVPPPASAKQAGKAVVTKMKGASPTLLVDQLGARLAFERNGVRLYQALLSKLDAFGSFDGGPSRADLEDILNDEQRHFTWLRDAVDKLGGDPTAMTPGADLEATLSMGVQAVMVDPRIDFGQTLEAALLAELADNEGWDTLIALTTKAGEDELANKFKAARDEEREHLEKVRRWMAAHREAA